MRYAGEVVAAVAAEDEDAAQEAIERIAVDYEELPGVFDVMDALATGAPLIHPDQMSYERAQVTGLVLNPVPDSNISYHFKLRRGDVDAAWSACDLVVEDTFSTQFVQYAHLEPHVTIALYDATGLLTLWASTMGPHTMRDMKAMLAQVGIDASIKAYTWATYIARIRQERDTAGCLWSIFISRQVDPSIILDYLSARNIKPGGANYGQWNNAQATELIESARATASQEKRKATYQQVQRIVYDQAPMIPLYNAVGVDLWSRTVEGLRSMESLTGTIQSVETVWLNR